MIEGNKSILHQPKQLEFWESTQNYSGDGSGKVRSKPTGRAGKGGLSKQKSKDSPDGNQQLSLFVTQESQVIPNVTILSDNLNTCASATQKRNSFQKLKSGLILGGENYLPFWNELSSRISSGLSLPTTIDCADLDKNWLSSYVNSMESNSWFSLSCNSAQNKSLYRICCPSSTASVLGYTNSESAENKLSRKYGNNPYKKSQNIQPNSIQKIPLFPDPELHTIWKQWLAAYRWVYNQCIEFYNCNGVLPKGTSLDQYIQQLQSKPSNEWTKCLGNTRQEAVCEASQARKQSLKANAGKKLLRFKSCRAKSQAIQFKNSAYRNGTWYRSKIGSLKFTVAKGYELPVNCVYGTELVYQRGQWFACFPQHLPVVGTGSDKVIALDPGNRTFLTGYDGENVLEIGKGDIGRLTRLCLHLDKIIGHKMKATGRVNKRLRYKLNRAIDKLRFKIRCLVDDLHRKASNLLTNSYKLIFLPIYETSKMVVKAKRKINRKSVRNMLTLAMGRFASHLEQAAKRKGVLVVPTNEAYTSKTCPKCGNIHRKLGGSKRYKCPHCGYTAPRDWVGALNILLRALQAIAFDVRDGVIVISDADVVVAQSHGLCEA